MSYPPPPSYPAASGPPGGPAKLRGKTLLILSAIFVVVAVVAFVVGIAVGTTKADDKVDGFQRIRVSAGAGTVRLDGTGRWVAYYEASNVSSDIKQIPHINLLITAPGGSTVTFDPYGNRSDGKIKKLTYDHDGHRGAAAVQFDAPAAGTYRVQLQPQQTLPSDARIAFGRDIAGGRIAGGVLVLVAILFLVAAIVLLIVGLVKRRNSKREPANPYGGYGPPPGYGGGYPQGPPPGYQGGADQHGPPQGPPPGYQGGGDQQGPPQGPPPGYQGGGYPPPSGS